MTSSTILEITVITLCVVAWGAAVSGLAILAGWLVGAWLGVIVAFVAIVLTASAFVEWADA